MMKKSLAILFAVTSLLVTARSYAKDFPNVISKVINVEASLAFSGVSIVTTQVNEALPQEFGTSYMTYSLNGHIEESILQLEDGKITFTIENDKLEALKSSLPLAVTLSINVPVTYPNVIKGIVSEEASAIDPSSLILYVELEQAAPQHGELAYVSFSLHGKEYQSMAFKKDHSHVISIDLPVAELEALRQSLPLPLAIINVE